MPWRRGRPGDEHRRFDRPPASSQGGGGSSHRLPLQPERLPGLPFSIRSRQAGRGTRGPRTRGIRAPARPGPCRRRGRPHREPAQARSGRADHPLARDRRAAALSARDGRPGLGGSALALARSRAEGGRVIPLAQGDIPGLPRRSCGISRPAGEGRGIILVPFPWQVMWAGLKTLEFLGLRLDFRSDSLLSLVNQDPKPDLKEARDLGLPASSGPGRARVAFGA